MWKKYQFYIICDRAQAKRNLSVSFPYAIWHKSNDLHPTYLKATQLVFWTTLEVTNNRWERFKIARWAFMHLNFQANLNQRQLHHSFLKIQNYNVGTECVAWTTLFQYQWQMKLPFVQAEMQRNLFIFFKNLLLLGT